MNLITIEGKTVKMINKKIMLSVTSIWEKDKLVFRKFYKSKEGNYIIWKHNKYYIKEMEQGQDVLQLDVMKLHPLKRNA